VGEASLIVGASGYVGRAVLARLRSAGVDAVAAVRSDAQDLGERILLDSQSSLDRALASDRFSQVVHLPQLTRDDVDWVIDRVDGPRWVVFSSAQVASTVPAPGTSLARAREQRVLGRGGIVLRPTMIFGRGTDRNLTRTIRFLRRWRIPILVGDGTQRIDPVHVDDVADLIVNLSGRTGRPDLYEIGGGCPTPVCELLATLCEILGVRGAQIRVPLSALRFAARAARVAGLRPDQVLRLVEDKTADDSAARASLAWFPAPLPHRLEQAVAEALSRR